MKNHSTQTPKWDFTPSQDCKPALRQLMQTTGHLTLALGENCNSSISVTILFEDIDNALPDETKRLNLQESKHGWVRCVLLKCHEKPLLYARSFIPLTDNDQIAFLHQEHEFSSIQHIGTQPLGIWLSQQTRLKRSPFEYAITHSNLWPHNPHQSTLQLPARRSCFSTASSRLLLSEVFLQP